MNTTGEPETPAVSVVVRSEPCKMLKKYGPPTEDCFHECRLSKGHSSPQHLCWCGEFFTDADRGYAT